MFNTTYTYDNPHGAGPFKGSMETDRKYKRGESISAPFGQATVKSSREIPKDDPLDDFNYVGSRHHY